MTIVSLCYVLSATCSFWSTFTLAQEYGHTRAWVHAVPVGGCLQCGLG